ncbi:MAG: phosphotransferase [Oscillospiraceae bacterium]|nr:phosphotransferase [Oscillospiraceae bacterium]
MKMIKPYLIHRYTDYEILSNRAKELSRSIDNMKMMQPPFYGFCHGDIHVKNVCFKGNKPTIFDFDCMGYGWRAYDICVFAWYETLKDEKYIEGDYWKAYIEGYNSVRQLHENEIISINAFSALRELWLMGHHADLMNRNEGCGWYNDDYFDFHIGIFKLWYKRFFSTSCIPINI